ncbi:MAG: hypothetical protein COA49_06975 [Bacteroidetes bacterium]|nr:MAG: hypothetical protein COA49_06975 [Bacteroidota bacterium]
MKQLLPLYLILLIITCFTSLESISQVSTSTQVSLVNNPIPHDVPASLKGVNQTSSTLLEYVNNPEFVSAFSAINPGTMRFPGGTSANNYDWKRELNNPLFLNLKNTIELANSVGAEINYVINYGTTTPSEAAELVHILNDTSPTYKTLRQNYFGDTTVVGVKYWELGNELAAKWEWHVSWVAGGQNQQIAYRSGEPVLDMPRTTTDHLHYFGGDISRKGWVPRYTDGMTVFNSILGTIHRVTAQEQADAEAVVDVKFGPITPGSAIVWLISDTSISVGLQNEDTTCDSSLYQPCLQVQQNLYDVITEPANLLDPSQYTVSNDGKTVTVNPTLPLLENQLILVEYDTHHEGAFAIRDAMKMADPSIEVGYCIDFRQTLINTPNFNSRLQTSPPDFLINHPYNSNTDLALNGGYLSEIIHIVDEKISHEFTPSETNLDSICSSLGIPEIGLALTEWNIRLCGSGDCNSAYNGILGGLYTANFYSQFQQAQADDILDIRLSNHFAGITLGTNLIHMWHYNLNSSLGPIIHTPQSEATRMVQDVIGDQMLHSSEILISNNPIIDIILFSTDTSGNNVFTPSTVNALKIYANDDLVNDTLEFLILNNDDESNHFIEFQLPCDRIGGDAILEVLIGDSSALYYNINLSTVISLGGYYTINAPSFSVCTLKIPYTSSSTSCSCFADFNGNGIVETNDFLDLLSEFGCAINCNYDLNADGVITSDDILIFLSLFGEPCI